MAKPNKGIEQGVSIVEYLMLAVGRLNAVRLNVLSNYFDVRIFSFVSGIIAITLWGCTLYVATTQKVYPGFMRGGPSPRY